MTIVNQSSRRTVQGNGSQTVFDYNFLIPSAAEAQLYLVDVASGAASLLPPSVWSLSGANNPLGGTFTYPIAGGAPALQITQKLTLVRTVPNTQVTSLQNQSGFQPRSLESALDRIVMQMQQIADGVSRSIRLPEYSPPNVSTLLPNPYPEKLIGWNANGTGLQNYDQRAFADYVFYAPYGSVSVENFGAVGDGVTDDSAAFAAAFAAAKHVIVPAGKVYSVSELTITDGVQVYAYGAVLRARSGARWIAKMSGFGTGLYGPQFEDTFAAFLVDQTTLASGAVGGAVSVSVATAGRIAPMMTVAIELDNGRWHMTTVMGVSGTTITLQVALPSAAASGKRAWFTHGALWLTEGLEWFAVDNVLFKGCWGAIVSKPSAFGIVGAVKGSVSRIKTYGARMFVASTIGDTADIVWDFTYAAGSTVVTNNYVGDGTTKTFAITDDVFRVGPFAPDLSVSVNGASTTAFTLPTSKSLTFTVAPPNGQAIVINNQVDGLVGFNVDSTGASIISGGHKISPRFLEFQYGMQFRNAQLYDIVDGFVDTISKAGLRWEGTNSSMTINNVQSLFVGDACLETAFDATVVNSSISDLRTSLVPASEKHSGILGVAAALSNGSNLLIDGNSWGGAKSRSGSGTITTPGGEGFPFNSSASVGAGTTNFFLTGNGVTNNESFAEFVAPFDGYITKLLLFSDVAPGAGQTYTATARINGSNTAASRVLSGASDFGGSWEGAVYVTAGVTITVRLVTSASAASAVFRGYLTFLRA
jgi:hypothetical protein